jgi:hypothetical protein
MGWCRALDVEPTGNSTETYLNIARVAWNLSHFIIAPRLVKSVVQDENKQE